MYVGQGFLRILCLAAAALLICTTWLSLGSLLLGPRSIRGYVSSHIQLTRWTQLAVDSGRSDVFNETLGFEKVFVIGLPERSDNRDALSLMTSVTGFRLTWIDGVHGSSTPDKALPFGWDRKLMPDTHLGSWRSHINAIRLIVEDGLSSALIMEDDMDWDVHLKTQLSQFAPAAQTLEAGFHRNQTLASPSPYGRDWDLLWLGSCATTFDAQLPEHLRIPEAERDGRQVLIRDNVYSFAYALSAAGARKALRYLGLEGQHKPFDNHPSDLCRLRADGMRGDSDIGGSSGGVRELGFTENMLHSTRLNLANLIRGLEPEQQWED
ncbi:hypothetical protein DL762_006374 [Monosporascus cannonballus]|uniref:Glycosyl transferase 64 domain-containing protein n=1 Tax=Monosporascus cannonballus TaxID=155416 RepID=A0ABY0H3A5_9PEZI|nr:hypothetical protein DL762_006374 [Monosporascus cannonballus]